MALRAVKHCHPQAANCRRRGSVYRRGGHRKLIDTEFRGFAKAHALLTAQGEEEVGEGVRVSLGGACLLNLLLSPLLIDMHVGCGDYQTKRRYRDVATDIRRVVVLLEVEEKINTRQLAANLHEGLPQDCITLPISDKCYLGVVDEE